MIPNFCINYPHYEKLLAEKVEKAPIEIEVTRLIR
jgi:hypothetical protein